MNFYYPSKPTRISIDSSVLEECDSDNNYIAQKKKDGWRIQIHKLGKEITLYTRHKRLLEPLIGDVNWEEMKQRIAEALPSDSCIIDGEFLHRRTTTKETFFLWDLFELNGKRQRGAYKERKAALNALVLPSEKILVLEDYSTGFKQIWDSLNREYDEGLVIKDLREPLYINFAKTIKSPRQFKILLDDPRNLKGDVEE